MDRSGVRRLLGIDPARTRIVDAEVSAPQPWEGISRSRVTLRASDGHTIPCLLQEPEHLSTPLPVVAIHQHNDEFHLGKSEPAGMAGNPNMAYGLALANAGVITLIPDLQGFEERRDPWLHAKIQSLAGRADGPPLTFGDLRRGGVTLRVMTTNLSHHQPMAMPWSAGEYYFDPDDVRRLFPADVVQWMVDHPPQPDAEPHGHLHPWPAADDLPVIVTTRMSLSFPGLISAVRLWAVDYTDPDNWETPSFSSVWFTDGGLCANLPVHFFDSPLPRHPTFAFNLAHFPKGRAKSADESENSYLPTGNAAGIQRPWFHLPTEGLGAWGSFAMTMVDTARTWVDAAQMVMPGYRDRSDCAAAGGEDHPRDCGRRVRPPRLGFDGGGTTGPMSPSGAWSRSTMTGA